MKFAGQLKFPDLDHPGLPVVFLVEDNHASILLDGESLGRWALFDVEATRLVAKAFQVHLDGEEITFIADEPIDFAYKGVEHMAQTWARAKALSLPRRTVVVRKIRRATQPSRLPELREAVVENLEAPAVEVRPAAAAEAAPRSSMSVADRIAAARGLVEAGQVPAALPTEIGADEEIGENRPKARLIPGPGLVSSLGTKHPAPEPKVDEPVEQVVEEPAAEEVVEEPAVEEVVEEVVEEPAVEEPAAEEVVEEPAAEEVVEEPIPVIEGWLDDEAAAPPEEVLTPWFAGAEETDDRPVSDDPIEWQYQPERLEAAAAATDEDEDRGELPEEVKELIGTPAGSDEGLFVDLGRYEDADDDDQDDGDSPSDGEQPAEREPVLVGTTQEKSGLFGAVRSAFVRSRAPHEHVFVDAPGGMGLTRQICADCGHISIRSDD